MKGNALERISDILKFHAVSSQAGTGFATLSFQLGYFPILEVIPHVSVKSWSHIFSFI
jgi:hypothetical protein